MNKLVDTDSGQYKIVTESGTEYEIDMDARELPESRRSRERRSGMASNPCRCVETGNG
jgi:hypothetical protein